MRTRAALVIGAGGLGGPAALGLAAAGFARVTLVDDDRVEAGNLARQLFFGDRDLGGQKAVLVGRALRARFADLSYEAVTERFGPENAADLVRGHDVVLDGSDNFPTRFLANDVCVRERRPLVHGAALRWLGQVLAIVPGRTACLRCVFEGEPPAGAAPTCAEAGVASPLVGLVGGWMAEAAVALLSGAPGGWENRMRTLDAFAGRERWAPVGRDPACAACGRLV